MSQAIAVDGRPYLSVSQAVIKESFPPSSFSLLVKAKKDEGKNKFIYDLHEIMIISKEEYLRLCKEKAKTYGVKAIDLRSMETKQRIKFISDRFDSINARELPELMAAKGPFIEIREYINDIKELLNDLFTALEEQEKENTEALNDIKRLLKERLK